MYVRLSFGVGHVILTDVALVDASPTHAGLRRVKGPTVEDTALHSCANPSRNPSRNPSPDPDSNPNFGHRPVYIY